MHLKIATKTASKLLRYALICFFVSVAFFSTHPQTAEARADTAVRATTTKGSIDSITISPPFHLRTRKRLTDLLSPLLSTSSPQGLTPSQVQGAYHLPTSGGTGTIALIEAYDDPNAESDLNTFSTQFGLPACTTGNGCFEKHEMTSSVSGNQSWGTESSLDVQWAHAIAPGAKILLVEARNSGTSNLLAAVDYARSRSDVVAISMSWGGTEFPGESSLDYHFVSPTGAVFFAAAGDSGAGVEWPAVSSNVIGVGGTTLNFSSSTFSSETAWSAGGGGLSSYEPEPGYQTAANVPNANGFRAVPDVSYNADPASGYSVYDSYGYGGQTGWFVVGGTSAGAPQWAAIATLGKNTASNASFYTIASNPLSYANDFRDIASGSNGSCGSYCTAGSGYDYVTGLGSPLVASFTLPNVDAEVTGASGGVSVPIDTTSYAGGTGTWTTLSGPTITETSPSQIGQGTHSLDLPSGWEFNTGHAVTVSISGTSSLALASTTIAPSVNSLSFSVATTSVSATSSLTFSGIQIRPTTSNALTFGAITHAGAPISGVTASTSFGSLSTASGAPISVGVETSSDGTGAVVASQSLSASSSIAVYSVTRDRFGNFVQNATSTWSLISKTGGVADGNLVVSDDTESATMTASLAGTAVIHVSSPGLTSVNSGVITVVPGVPMSIALTASATSTTPDSDVTYGVIGTDANGNSGDVTASTTFSISGNAGGSFASGVYTPQRVGTFVVTATCGSSSATSSLVVSVGNPYILNILTQPANTNGVAGNPLQQQPVIQVTDQGGNDVPDGVAVTAAVVSGHGTQSALENYVATTTGGTGLATFSNLTYANSGEVFELNFSTNGHTSSSSNDVSALSSVNVVNSSGDGGGGGGGSSGGGGGGGGSVSTTPSAVATYYSAPVYALTASGSSTSAQVLAGSSTLGASASAATQSSLLRPVAGMTFSFSRDLGVGMTGGDVTALQEFLNQQGFVISSSGVGSPGNETDMFGQKTKAALARFQVAEGISPATGYLGPRTRAYINALGVSPAGTQSSPSLSAQVGQVSQSSALTSAQNAQALNLVPGQTTGMEYPFVRDLTIGMTGDDVTALQNLLIESAKGPAALSLATVGATGRFGAMTEAALLEYQQAVGISPATGYFGPKTRAYLQSVGK